MATKKTSKKKTRGKNSNNNTATTETKAEKFSRLGSMRATKAINAMRGLQKLANRNNYEYTPEQVEKLVTALKTEVEAVYNAFTSTGGSEKETFTL